MFQCWFNTAFLNFEGILTVRKNILDGCKVSLKNKKNYNHFFFKKDKLHKKFSKNFEFEIFGKFLENSKNMFDLSYIPVRLNI